MVGRRRHNIRPKEVGVKLTLPFVGEISGTRAPDDAESKAAWELYIELITGSPSSIYGPAPAWCGRR